jgi:hypothetical protein
LAGEEAIDGRSVAEVQFLVTRGLDIMAGLAQRGDEIGADEAVAPSDEDSHGVVVAQGRRRSARLYVQSASITA